MEEIAVTRICCGVLDGYQTLLGSWDLVLGLLEVPRGNLALRQRTAEGAGETLLLLGVANHALFVLVSLVPGRQWVPERYFLTRGG